MKRTFSPRQTSGADFAVRRCFTVVIAVLAECWSVCECVGWWAMAVAAAAEAVTISVEMPAACG